MRVHGIGEQLDLLGRVLQKDQIELSSRIQHA